MYIICLYIILSGTEYMPLIHQYIVAGSLKLMVSTRALIEGIHVQYENYCKCVSFANTILDIVMIQTGTCGIFCDRCESMDSTGV